MIDIWDWPVITPSHLGWAKGRTRLFQGHCHILQREGYISVETDLVLLKEVNEGNRASEAQFDSTSPR